MTQKDEKQSELLSFTEDGHFRLIRALNEFLLRNRKDKLLASAGDGVKVTKFIEELYR